MLSLRIKLVNERRYLSRRHAWRRVKEGSSWAKAFQPELPSKKWMYAAWISHNTIPELHSCEILTHKLPDSYLWIIEIESEVELLDFNMNLNMLERFLTEVEEVVVNIDARSLADLLVDHRRIHRPNAHYYSTAQLCFWIP